MYSYMVTNFNYITHVITFYPPIAIVHYGIYYNSYANQTINNYVDQNNKYDIVPIFTIMVIILVNIIINS